jgi:hypothetical protein
MSRNGEPAALRNRYICIRGDWPSGGVSMFALSTWFASGRPFTRFAPSSVSTFSGSEPANAPSAAVKLMGGFSRWSWNTLAYQKACTASCWRLVCQLRRVRWSHEHRWRTSHAPAAPTAVVKSVNGYEPGGTSSPGSGASVAGLAELSLMSDQACANGPTSAVAVAGFVRYGSRTTARWTSSPGAPG